VIGTVALQTGRPYLSPRRFSMEFRTTTSSKRYF